MSVDLTSLVAKTLTYCQAKKIPKESKNMGQIIRVSCQCGFNTSATIGGGMTTFKTDSSFPFYCEKDGLIEVNVQKEIICPCCQSKDIYQYGKAPVSIEKEGYGGVQWGNYSAHRHGNLCPKCKKMTLELGPSEIYFD
jgi:hypothetical protein